MCLRHVIATLLYLAAFAVPSSVVAEKPPHWPWRGVVVNSCCSGIVEDAVAKLAGMGANAILLNIRARSYAELSKVPPEKAWEESLAWVDRMLDACREQGIIGIVRLTQLPVNPDKDFNEKSPQFWAKDGEWQESVRLAGLLAQRFRNRGAELGAYSVLSEPTMRIRGRAVKPPNWNKVQSMIIAAIREHDLERHIVVAPGPGGMPVNYRSFNPIDDPAIIYGAHMYVPHTFTHQGIGGRKAEITYPGNIRGRYWDKEQLRKTLSDLRAFQEEHGALVFVGEFSVVRGAPGANRYLSDAIGLFNEFDWGWTYFLYQGNPLWSVGETTTSMERRQNPKLKATLIPPAGRLELLSKMWQNDFGRRQAR